MNPARAPEVKRRKVFYIAGFDPMHPRRYREFYRREGAAQADISGYTFNILPRSKGKGPFGWQAEVTVDGETSQADIALLVWSDLVRDQMKGGILHSYLQMVRTLWIYTTTGTLFRLAQMRRGPVLAAFYPIAILLVQAIAALLLGGAVGAVALALPLAGWSRALVWCALAAAAAYAVLRWFKARDGKVLAHYLMLDYAFAAHWRGAYAPALQARLAQFAGEVTAALSQDYDEVLVIGHSSGAQLAVSVVADVMRTGQADDRLALLTLGQVIPMMSFLPDAQRLRADLQMLAGQKRVAWVDVSAPGDACCFALCDPPAVTGVAPDPQLAPLVLSAAFTQTLSAQMQRDLRGKWFRLHFQYLHAFDRPRDYDYFLITAGPVKLADRYRGRAHSASRLARPLSSFRDTA
ncbi:hypothetical protein BVG79_01361 [Ketogulonicigenium robustum]|uniref:Uncharacterized protein n=1 Tax=Ketogulonicigenium robustum TaxID=92947 RepID=A0A1W6P0A8_9RHOB|nr:hypothetical protein [Ketogulonicigenium robustum]ARO14707.1 hypothetical protein BVG79_01361 [Ketogulonicigenium robustum]